MEIRGMHQLRLVRSSPNRDCPGSRLPLGSPPGKGARPRHVSLALRYTIRTVSPQLPGPNCRCRIADVAARPCREPLNTSAAVGHAQIFVWVWFVPASTSAITSDDPVAGELPKKTNTRIVVVERGLRGSAPRPRSMPRCRGSRLGVEWSWSPPLLVVDGVGLNVEDPEDFGVTSGRRVTGLWLAGGDGAIGRQYLETPGAVNCELPEGLFDIRVVQTRNA